MARVAVLTLHTPYLNFGSVLQAYALCRVLVQLGQEPVLVDYRRSAYRGWRLVRRRFFEHEGTTWTRAGDVVAMTAEALIAMRRIASFVHRHIPLSPRTYRRFDALSRNPPQADVYLAGSDQIWNSVYNEGIDETFYLAFAPATSRRVSYAASFGFEELPLDEQARTRGLLQQFEAISVRETAGLTVLDKIGLSGTKVLDPTLLLSAEEWGVLASPVHETNYVLLYCVDDRRMPEATGIARAIADDLGARLLHVTFGSRRRHLPGVDRTFAFASPETFVSLYAGARFVVACSMHGTAFSILFEKDFVSLAPTRFEHRVEDLLDTLFLADRYIPAGCSASVASGPVDFSRTRHRLVREREISRRFLASAVGLPS